MLTEDDKAIVSLVEAVKAEKRILKLAVPDKEWAVVALALTHEAENLYNTCTFLIPRWNYCLKRSCSASGTKIT